jgi:hypothetical protein
MPISEMSGSQKPGSQMAMHMQGMQPQQQHFLGSGSYNILGLEIENHEGSARD